MPAVLRLGADAVKIYLQMPSAHILGEWALARFTDATEITVSTNSGAWQGIFRPPAGVRPVGVPYTFTADYLWALMQQDQADYEREHPTAEAEYVRG